MISECQDVRRAGLTTRCTRRCFIKGVGAAGTVSGLGGVSNVVVASRGDADTTSTNQLSEIWSAELPATVREYLIDGKRLHVASDDGSLRTINIETGRETDRINLGQSIKPYGLAKDGQWLAVGLANGRLLIMNEDSFSVAQEIPFDGKFRGVAAKKGLVCLGTGAGTEILRLDDGSVRWRFDNSVKSPVWVTSEGFALAEHRPQSSSLTVLSAETGERKWKTSSGWSRTTTGNWLEGNNFWGLRETKSYLSLASSNAKHRLFDKYTGEQLWADTDGKGTNRPAVGSDQVFHGLGAGVHATDIETGKRQWGTDVVSPHAKGIVLFDGSLIVFGTRSSDGANVMMSLDPNSRAIQWETEIDGPIGLISTLGNMILGVDLKRDEIQAYVSDGAKADISDGATPTPNNGVQGGAGGDSRDDSTNRSEGMSTTPTGTRTSTPIETRTPTETKAAGQANSQNWRDILPVALGLVGLGGAGGAGAWWMIKSDDDSPKGGPSDGGTAGEAGIKTPSESSSADQPGSTVFPESGASATTSRGGPTETLSDQIKTQHIPETIPSVPDLSVDYDALTDEEPIGGGGNADVVKATLPTPDGDVTLAIKRPRMAGTLHTDAVERMLAEAETWEKLNDHDHIVGVVDYGSEPLPWIAMEYMDGGHLGDQAGDLDTPQALWTAIAVTDAVHYAHYRRGVAHLDLKPANVLFRTVEDAWDVPKVGDWGLSKHLINQSQSIEGLSPQYAAPEQFDERYGATDTSTDIYQLGATFYTLFTGRPPFGDEPRKAMRKVLDEEPTPPSQVADVPKDLDEILLTALAKEKDERYDNVAYLRDALKELFDKL